MGSTTLEYDFEKPNLLGSLRSRRGYLLPCSPSCGFKVAVSDVKDEGTCTLGLVSKESSNDVVVSSRGVVEPGGGMTVASCVLLCITC